MVPSMAAYISDSAVESATNFCNLANQLIDPPLRKIISLDVLRFVLASLPNDASVQGHSVDKKMAKPHEQLFFLNFKKMATFLRLSFLKKIRVWRIK